MAPDQSLVEMTANLPAQPPEHFCIAPFQSIRQNPQGRNSPCAFGAGEWDQKNLTPVERWHSQELNNLRREFLQGNKPKECHRCWAEEDAGKKSLRQRQYDYFPDDYQNLIRSGSWIAGPKTAVFKTSNVCNLACRSCGAWDSNSFTQEGQHYADVYLTRSLRVPNKLSNRFIPRFPPQHMDFMNYEKIVDNLEKIDFFGGEPLLNITQLDLLEHLADRGLSKKITLFYSTNCTNLPTERLKRSWNKFRRVEISMSIDGIGPQFEYLRWPGKWSEALAVMDHIKNLEHSLDCEVYTMAGLTISAMNAYYTDQTCAWLQEHVGDIYINMVNTPDYLALHVLPQFVKDHIKQTVTNQEVLGYIDLLPHDPKLWKQFIIWMKRQDLYRNQNFATAFPEFHSLIEQSWNSITDLSENNFYDSQ